MEKLLDVVPIHDCGIKGLEAKLIKRTDSKAMYLRNDGVYEVFRIEIDPEQTIFGKTYPARERYPKSEDFGNLCHCYTSLKKADEFYALI